MLFRSLKEKILDKNCEIKNSDDEYKSLLEIEKQIESQKSLIDSSKKQIEKIKTEIQNSSNNSEELQEETNSLHALHGTLENLKEDLESRIQQKRNYEICVSLLKDSGIKSKIIKQYLPVVNKVISKFLKSMNFFTQFELDEEFNETIKSRFRDKFSYMSFSEGEKLRIDLALLFTWRTIAKMKNSTNTNLLILDEIFDSSLDGQGTEDFFKILKTLTNENTFIISHKGDILFDKFTSIIKFEKYKNFTRIAQIGRAHV